MSVEIFHQKPYLVSTKRHEIRPEEEGKQPKIKLNKQKEILKSKYLDMEIMQSNFRMKKKHIQYCKIFEQRKLGRCWNESDRRINKPHPAHHHPQYESYPEAC
jgi:hypothetical protein